MLLYSAACVVLLATSVPPTVAAPQARDVLAATGIQGGLVVQVGCGDAELLVGLRASKAFLVHGLDTDPAVVAKARAHVRSRGLYGPVAVDRFDGRHLPYVDGLVNLLVSADLGEVPIAEVMRVLAPGGAAYVRQGGRWQVRRKDRRAEIDDWPHTLYDASNNAVSGDRVVGPPQRIQWVAEPTNARHHERLASVSAAVSAGGRLFAIVDEAPTASILLPSRWSLWARDAFSGVALWRRPIGPWEDHLRPFRSGPPQLSRRLVATAGTVYVTLGYGRPLTALDAATGKTLRTYEATAGTEEIRHDAGTLYLVVAETPAGNRDAPPAKHLLAVDAATGRVLWRRPDAAPLPTTLAITHGRAFYQDATHLVCLDARAGKELWRSARPAAAKRPGWSAPTLVATADVVLSADRLAAPAPEVFAKARKQWAAWLVNEGPPGELIAFSAETGKELWRCQCAETYHAPVDVFVVDGLVWVGDSASRSGPDFAVGRDLRTGEIKRRIDPSKAYETTMPHHRCHRNRVAGGRIVSGRTGVEFIDLVTGAASRHHWVRGVCQYGTLPCNGLLYAPPHSCACYIEAKLTGFLALSPCFAEATQGRPSCPPPERGPAFSSTRAPHSALRHPDWPTFRHDAARTGATPAAVDPNLTCLWQAELSGRVTPPVVAEGLAVVAAIDEHSVHAFDAKTGKARWRHVAGGRIDSPPTVHAGRVVFGSADGSVRCLRAADGQLAWRFRAAGRDRRIVARGQVESSWPVPGSVLVHDGTVSFAAGRNTFLDGGMGLFRLKLATGEVLACERLYTRDPNTGEQPDEPQRFHMTGALPDVLSFDGERVYLRRLTLDPDTLKPAPTRRHLYSPAGFLNGDWWHRTYWVYGTHFYSGYIGWYFAGRETPAGRLLVMDDAAIYGFGYRPDYYRGSTGREYHLFAVDRSSLPAQPEMNYDRARREYPARGQGKQRMTFRWSRRMPLLARAMVLAGDRLFLAGPPRSALQLAEAFDGERGGRVAVVSAADGNTVAEYELDALPACDGLAAAGGRLYLSTADGRVLCLGAGPPAPAAPKGKAAPIRPFLPNANRPKDTKAPGLVGCWKLDEGEGPVAYDTSGGRHDGEVRGRWTRGPRGPVLDTAGRPGALTLPDGPHLHFGTGGFTVAFWVKVNDFDHRLMGKEDFPRRWWVVNLLKDGRIEMVLGQGRGAGEQARPKSKAVLAAKTWTHVAFAVDRAARQVRCYLNGAPDRQTPLPAGLTAPLDVKGTDLRIPSSHKPFAGSVDELRIYSRALADAEVRALFEDKENAEE